MSGCREPRPIACAIVFIAPLAQAVRSARGTAAEPEEVPLGGRGRQGGGAFVGDPGVDGPTQPLDLLDATADGTRRANASVPTNGGSNLGGGQSGQCTAPLADLPASCGPG